MAARAEEGDRNTETRVPLVIAAAVELEWVTIGIELVVELESVLAGSVH